jgi:predicted ATPase
MIKDISVVDFKSFAFREPVSLPQFLVLVGDNGAGKTNFCDVFDFTRELVENGLRQALLGERRGGFVNVVRGRQRQREIDCRFTLAETDGTLHYEFRVGLGAAEARPMVLAESVTGADEEVVYLKREAHVSEALNERPSRNVPTSRKNWALHLERWGIEADYLQITRLADEIRFPTLRRVRDMLRSMLVLRPDVHALRESATVGGELRLGSGGEGLPAVLDAADPGQLDRLAGWLSEGEGLAQSIRLLPAGPGKKVIGLLERGESEAYQPDQISDGTLRLLAMLAAIMGIAPGISTLVIEEPENGIHFSRLRRLIELCRQRTQQDPTAQIILTTHSIPLLHQLQREEVMAVVRGEDGISQLLPPPDADKWQRFREEAGYTIGNLYSTGLWPAKNRRASGSLSRVKGRRSK